MSNLGYKLTSKSIEYSFYCKDAQDVYLCLFNQESKLVEKIQLSKRENHWHCEISKCKKEFLYCYEIHRNNENFLVSDPYAQKVEKDRTWGSGIPLPLLAKIPSTNTQLIKKPLLDKKDLIIYEMHVRGFTQDKSSQTKHPGTFLGIIEKIDYLKKLGATAIELMPIFVFDETDSHSNCNFWGYDPINFFSIHPGYGVYDEVDEFKQMVNVLHQNNIEVILDVVYNHTGEGDKNPNINYSLIDKENYYLLKDGEDVNFSGCGNTFNCQTKAGSQIILDSLVYWTNQMGIDGFRFDLASILTRNNNHEIDFSLLEKIQNHPELKNAKFIAEPWDCAGLYQVGQFQDYGFSEWNDKYRDSVRNFINYQNDKEGFIQSLLGTPKVYHEASSTINFVTAHDGFSLHDLVSYEYKHNQSNNENNQDGSNSNTSCNYGKEGKTNSPDILKIRKQQLKNFLISLMASNGVPMLLMGDEYGHTKDGNNNTYCHDDHLNYFQWDLLETNHELLSFTQKLIEIRKELNFSSMKNLKHVLKEKDRENAIFIELDNTYLLAFNFNSWPISLPNNTKVLLSSAPVSSNYLESFTGLILTRF